MIQFWLLLIMMEKMLWFLLLDMYALCWCLHYILGSNLNQSKSHWLSMQKIKLEMCSQVQSESACQNAWDPACQSTSLAFLSVNIIPVLAQSPAESQQGNYTESKRQSIDGHTQNCFSKGWVSRSEAMPPGTATFLNSARTNWSCS